MTILDRNGIAFDPLWIAEFRGFFAGEGSLSLQIIHRRGAKIPLFRPRCRISLRLDDELILREFRIRIGGSLFFTDKQSSVRSPTVTWDASSLCHALIIRQLLSHSILPAKKFLEVPVWTEAVDLLSSRITTGYGWGGRRTSDEMIERLTEISRILREYKICKVQLPVK